jgi:hypothetical protein
LSLGGGLHRRWSCTLDKGKNGALLGLLHAAIGGGKKKKKNIKDKPDM